MDLKIPIIIAFNIALYCRTWKFGVIIDDWQRYEYLREGVFNWKGWIGFIKMIPLRLFGAGTFGTNLVVDHMFTTALHATASVMVFLALNEFDMTNQIAFWAAMLYSCHPVNHQTAVWMNGRRYAIVTILVMASIWIGTWAYPLYLLAFLFQFTGVFAPIVFAIEYPWIGLVIPPVIAAILYWKREKIQDRLNTITSQEMKKFTPRRLIIVVKAYGFYFFKLIVPGTLMMIYPNLYYWGLTEEGNKKAYDLDIEFDKGMAAIMLTVLVGQKLWPFHHLFMLWIFMVLSILQWCAILMSAQLFADRHMSIASAVMMFFVVMFVHNVVPGLDEWILGALMGFYCCRTVGTMEMYKGPWNYYDYHIFHAPACPNPRNAKITDLLSRGHLMAAAASIEEGLKYNPNDFSLLTLASFACMGRGDNKNAEGFLKKAEKNFYIGQEEAMGKEIAELRKGMK